MFGINFDFTQISLEEQLLYIGLPIMVIVVLFLILKLRQKITISKTVMYFWGGVTYLIGFAVYMLGYCHDGTANSLFALIIRPLLSALGMFVYNCNVGDLNPLLKESSLYMTVFAIVHFSAVLFSTMTVVLFWGVRLRAKLALFIYSFRRSYDKVYIFWGINDNSIQLGKNILEKHITNSQREKVIFVALPKSDDKAFNSPSVISLLSSHSYDNDEIKKVAELEGEIIAFAKRGYQNPKYQDDKYLNNIGLRYLAKYIKKSKEVFVYNFSYKALDNVKNVLAISKDSKVKAKKDSVEFYCLAKRENVNLLLENTLLSENINVKFLDSAFLSLTSLMLDREGTSIENYKYKNHPVNFVDIDSKTGGVTSKFTSMVLGFGTTGQNILRFLYEYGAFADPKGEKSLFKCYVFDDNMDTILPEFKHSVPYFVDNDEVVFKDCPNKTQEFWDVVDEELDNLNYIVLALGSDPDNISVLGELFHLILEKRNNGFDKLHICIRSYDVTYEPILDRIVKGYNKIVGNDGGLEVISIFGKSSSVFSWDMIMNDELLRLADEFEKQYNANCKNPVLLEQIKTGKNTSDYFEYQTRKRKEYMNYSNGLHIYTKKVLMGNNPNPTIEMISNISIGEHLRWNAATYMMGYVMMNDKVKAVTKGTCNEKYRQHICLVPFYDLDDENRGYDVQVVAKTIKVLHPEYEQKVEEVVKKAIEWYKK